MADETKQVSVICGPYQGARLTMTTADADAAIGAHWARDPYSGEPYGSHPALSDEERTAALTAAKDWAQLQWDHAGNPPVGETIPEARKKQRAMQAETDPNYKTR